MILVKIMRRKIITLQYLLTFQTWEPSSLQTHSLKKDKKQICKKYWISLLVYYKNIHDILVYTETWKYDIFCVFWANLVEQAPHKHLGHTHVRTHGH